MLNMAGDKGVENKQVKKAQFSLLQSGPIKESKEDISFLNEVQLELDAELGSTFLNLKEVINLYVGQVIALNRIAGDTVDLRANRQWLAYGEVLVLNEVLGIRINSFNKKEYSARGVK